MDEFDQIRGLLHEVRDLAAPIGVGNAQISVSAGGIGVWVAVTACLVMMAALLVGTVFVAIGMSDLNRQAQELRQTDQTIQAYINAGLVQPKEEQK